MLAVHQDQVERRRRTAPRPPRGRRRPAWRATPSRDSASMATSRLTALSSATRTRRPAKLGRASSSARRLGLASASLSGAPAASWARAAARSRRRKRLDQHQVGQARRRAAPAGPGRRIRRCRSPERGCGRRAFSAAGSADQQPGGIVRRRRHGRMMPRRRWQIAAHGRAGGRTRDARATAISPSKRGQLRRPARTLSGRSKPNTEPLPTSLVDAQPAAHRLDQPPADGQAQPGAAEPAGGRLVGLAEGLEQAGDLVLGDADAGVAHRDAQAAVRARGSTCTSTAPVSVNLMALLTRLPITWRSRTGSASISAGRRRVDVGGQVQALFPRPLPEQATTSSTISARSAGAASSVILPASIFEKSRMSLMMAIRLAPDLAITSAKRRCAAAGRRRPASRPSPSRRSSACGSRGSWWPGSRTWRGWRPRPASLATFSSPVRSATVRSRPAMSASFRRGRGSRPACR